MHIWLHASPANKRKKFVFKHDFLASVSQVDISKNIINKTGTTLSGNI